MAMIVIVFPGKELLQPAGERALVQGGGHLLPISCWVTACETARTREDGGLILAGLDAMEKTLRPPTTGRTFAPARQPASPPARQPASPPARQRVGTS